MGGVCGRPVAAESVARLLAIRRLAAIALAARDELLVLAPSTSARSASEVPGRSPMRTVGR